MNCVNQFLTLILYSYILMAFTTRPNLEGTKCHIAPTYVDLFYAMGPRFEPITKTALLEATSVADFFEPEHLQPLLNYEYVEIVLVEKDEPTDKRISNNFFKLSDAQRKMLCQMDYSEHFLIRAPFKTINQETGEVEYFKAEPHFTVVPETQASYSLGEKALIDYIAQANRENTINLDEDKLQYAKLYFTVSTTGAITHVYLDRSCGNERIDNAMIELISNAPGKWTPAENTQGKKVDQELAITFGVGGC